MNTCTYVPVCPFHSNLIQHVIVAGEDEKGGTDLKITRISTQKKNTERFNIYIEREGKEEYAFAVDADILIKYNLQRDKELDDDFVKEVLTAEEQQKAYRLSLNHLSYRMRATSEVESYLIEKETPEHAVKHAIKRLTDQKYLNDQQFAEAYTATKKATTPQGPGKIRRDLEMLKIQKTYIDQALTAFTEEEELEKVLKFLRQKQKELARRSVRELKAETATNPDATRIFIGGLEARDSTSVRRGGSGHRRICRFVPGTKILSEVSEPGTVRPGSKNTTSIGSKRISVCTRFGSDRTG